MKITIKTHRPGNPYSSHHLFILSKGYNAGKPLEKECANCFVILADSKEEKEKLYWICYCFWKSGLFLPYLCGSVIPFLHITDLKKLVYKSFDVFESKPFLKSVNSLQDLIRSEKLLRFQLKLIDKIKASIAKRLLTDHFHIP